MAQIREQFHYKDKSGATLRRRARQVGRLVAASSVTVGLAAGLGPVARANQQGGTSAPANTTTPPPANTGGTPAAANVQLTPYQARVNNQVQQGINRLAYLATGSSAAEADGVIPAPVPEPGVTDGELVESKLTVSSRNLVNGRTGEYTFDAVTALGADGEPDFSQTQSFIASEGANLAHPYATITGYKEPNGTWRLGAVYTGRDGTKIEAAALPEPGMREEQLITKNAAKTLGQISDLVTRAVYTVPAAPVGELRQAWPLSGDAQFIQ